MTNSNISKPREEVTTSLRDEVNNEDDESILEKRAHWAKECELWMKLSPTTPAFEEEVHRRIAVVIARVKTSKGFVYPTVLVRKYFVVVNKF